MSQPRKRKAHSPHPLGGGTATAILHRMDEIAAERANLDEEQAALTQQLACLIRPPDCARLPLASASPVPPAHPPRRPTDTPHPPVAKVILEAHGALSGHRFLIVWRRKRGSRFVGKVKLPLPPEAFLLLCVLASSARSKFIEVGDLLDELAELREEVMPGGSEVGSTMARHDVHSLVNKLRVLLAPYKLAHLIATSPCKGGGYRLNARVVRIPGAFRVPKKETVRDR